MSERPVAVLLRAVNLAGRRLAMADFKAVLADAGLSEARTLGASGNAVAAAVGADGVIESRVEAAFKAAYGASPEVFVRDHAALAAVVAGNPFAKLAEAAPSQLLVMFLRGAPQAEAVAALRAKVAGPEEFAPGPGCLYVSYPDGIGRSKLTGGLIERTLRLRGTGRNWNTTTRLAALLEPA
ncbi:DUF1697 domain-containing protein [Phenylobacterium sp. LjRoot219]|uniref:DUF1697 domain-containing protein n=1 Tax=Phenylobacterium sp. LjRoot219 TaxID=3342283 RepID=UPI003ECC3613